MKFDSTFLRSRLARRVFLIFICCAVLPITALFYQSFSQVTSGLNEQSYRRLQQLSKALGMATFERLLLLESHMRMISSNLKEKSSLSIETKGVNPGEGIEDWFISVSVLADDGTQTPLVGKMTTPPILSSQERQRLESGKTAIVTRPSHNSTSRIFMLRQSIDKDSEARFLVGEINNAYLWSIGPENALPPMTELCVLDPSGNLIISSLPAEVSMVAKVAYTGNSSTSRQFQWKYGDKNFLASYWTLFLKARFDTPNWTVVLSQSTSEVLAPMAYFRRVYPLMTLLCLLVVLLLSMIYIRRTLDPLKTLKDGTLQISSGDFDHRVEIATGDELEELAASFNTMSGRLGRQFRALNTMAELDRAILSSVKSQKIVDVILNSMHDFFLCDSALICLFDPEDTGRAHVFVRSAGNNSGESVEVVDLGPQDIRMLKENPRYLRIDMDKDKDSLRYLLSSAGNGIRSFVILPVFMKDELLAIVNMGYSRLERQTEQDAKDARRLADQMAVGLSNSRLFRELDQLNWGALQALARTVDAKSPWTAGHSERVTSIALRIADSLNLTSKEMDMLHRAALLHDIGKIGTPHSILEKQSTLTDEEYKIIKEHPSLGARILEPIGAYKEIIPIIAQHHERFDGKGYPRGLAGGEIVLAARILAVADVFDALVSERPYRAGWNLDRVIEHMLEQAGHQFDPEIVDVFLKTLAKREKKDFIGVHAYPYTGGLVET